MTKLATSCKGMLKVSKVHAACNVARFYEISHVNVSKEIKTCNRLDLTHLFLMSKVSKVIYSIYIYIHSVVCMSEVSKLHLIYTVDSNTKYSNYMEL